MRIAVALLAALAFGCGDKPDDGGHDKDGHGHEDNKAETALKALGAADENLARAQKTCPVSGEDLGSMGTPVKVSGAGKTVFLCCEGCRKRFEADPEKYVKKLGG
jgi:Cu(I)/Ag(I) efflux system membrane fusion protein